MRRIAISLAALLLLLAAFLVAQQQVATVTSTGTFVLRGAKVTPSGVPSWPVMEGDEIASGSEPVTFIFPDGSKIVLAPHSKCRIEMDGQTPVFRLTEGQASYTLTNLKSVEIYSLGQLQTPTATTGTLALKGRGFWTPRNDVIIGGAGAAAGIATGFAVTNGGAPVSPRR